MHEIYFDNSATTKVCDIATQKVLDMMQRNFGNPSSLHSKGINAECSVTSSRQSIASVLGCSKNEIVFTSGGTESNNIAIQGAAFAKNRLGNRIVTSEIEHASVYDTCTFLKHQGFEVIRLCPDSNGYIRDEDIYNAIDSNTILVSLMLINNENGVYLPVKTAANAIKRAKSPALLHCDAVQAFGKIPVKPSALGVDLLSISGHKIHAPKGVGALYIKKGIKITPIFYGGAQESSLRPGTESSPLIAGFGAAVNDLGSFSANLELASSLKDTLVQRLKNVSGIHFNSPDSALPYIVNVSVIGIRSEVMLHYLGAKNIFISSGSACSKGKKSRVLMAMGLSDDRINSALRISFSKYNTPEDVVYLADAIINAQKDLIKYS